jgi:hypothetical protein
MTFEGEIFDSFKAAREHIIGEGDSFQYYNPKTGRPIKKIKNYNSVILYSHNDHFGYKGLLLIRKRPPGHKGVIVTNELFDQEGNMSFNDMWEAMMMYVSYPTL